MSDDHFKATLEKLAFATIVCLLILGYFSFCKRFPYYFIWDMDHTVSLDTLLIQSNYFPDHIYHTSFGIHLLLFFTQKIAYAFQWISVLRLNDLYLSLNPFAGMVELTDFNRAHSPMLAIAIVLSLWTSVQIVFKPPFMLSTLALILLGTQESLFYQSSMIRTECYSIFYWSLALLCFAIALQIRKYSAHFILIFLSGIFLGLSYLTKIQALFYLLLFPFLSIFFTSINQASSDRSRKKTRKWPVYLSLINFLVFTALAIASWLTPIPKGFVIFESIFQISPIAILFFMLFFGLFALQASGKGGKWDLIFFTILSCGFIGSFFLHFLLYKNPVNSFAYLLYDFKMVFLRKMTPRGNPFENFMQTLGYHPILFLSHLSVLGFIVVAVRRKIFVLSKHQLALCLILTVGAFVNLYLSTRFYLRDLIWTEMLFNLLTVSYIFLVLKKMQKTLPLSKTILAGFFVLLIAIQAKHACSISHRLQANYNHYGWQEDRLFQEVYSGNQLPYRFFMNERYDEKSNARVIAKRNAKQLTRIKNDVAYVFQNQRISLRNIGIVSENFPVWNEDLSIRFQKIPEDLREAILVNNMHVPLQKHFLFREGEMTDSSEFLNKMSDQDTRNNLSLLNRADLGIYLFLAKQDYERFSPTQKDSLSTITVSRESQAESYYGLAITNYTLLSLEKITRPYFFVIKQS